MIHSEHHQQHQQQHGQPAQPTVLTPRDITDRQTDIGLAHAPCASAFTLWVLLPLETNSALTELSHGGTKREDTEKKALEGRRRRKRVQPGGLFGHLSNMSEGKGGVAVAGSARELRVPGARVARG